MLDLKLSCKSNKGFEAGKLDVRFSHDGNLETIDDSEEIYLQNLMKAALDRNREVGYGVDISSFRGQKDLVITRTIIQDRIIKTIAFLNRFYPVQFRASSTNIIPLADQLLLRVVLDKATIQLVF